MHRLPPPIRIQRNRPGLAGKRAGRRNHLDIMPHRGQLLRHLRVNIGFQLEIVGTVEEAAAQQKAQDPIIQMQQQELQLKQAEQQRKMQKDQADTQLDAARLQLDAEKAKTTATIEASRIAAQNKQAQAKNDLDEAKAILDLAKARKEGG